VKEIIAGNVKRKQTRTRANFFKSHLAKLSINQFVSLEMPRVHIKKTKKAAAPKDFTVRPADLISAPECN
jgi:hypothetical protein